MREFVSRLLTLKGGVCYFTPEAGVAGDPCFIFFVKLKGKSGVGFFSGEMGTLDYLVQIVTVEVSSGIFVFLTKGTDKGCLG